MNKRRKKRLKRNRKYDEKNIDLNEKPDNEASKKLAKCVKSCVGSEKKFLSTTFVRIMMQQDLMEAFMMLIIQWPKKACDWRTQIQIVILSRT